VSACSATTARFSRNALAVSALLALLGAIFLIVPFEDAPALRNKQRLVTASVTAGR
jgi:hypothetical protein